MQQEIQGKWKLWIYQAVPIFYLESYRRKGLEGEFYRKIKFPQTGGSFLVNEILTETQNVCQGTILK